MEIQVQIVQILPQQSGISAKGNSWTKDTFICETFDQYPRKVAFTIFNISDKGIQIPMQGTNVIVHFDIESRSYVGRDGIERWSTEATALRIDPVVHDSTPEYQTAQQAFAPDVPVAPQHAAAAQPQPTYDLPF